MPHLFLVNGALPGAVHRVFIAVPSYGGTPRAICQSSLAASFPALHKAGIGYQYGLLAGHCHVDDARNSLVRDFLQSDCTDFMFIDDDMGWRAEDLVKIIEADGDIVCGAYRYKGDDEDYPIRMLSEDIDAHLRADGLIEIAGAPTGFMRIRRHVLESMTKAAGASAYYERHDNRSAVAAVAVLFERSLADNARFSGDYTFCNKARAAGFRIFTDPEMSFEHAGEKVWSGSVGDFWRRHNGIDHPRFASAVKALRSGNTDGSVFFDLHAHYGNPFSAKPELLAALHTIVSQAGGAVLETGSGLSTLVMALAARGNAHIHALEHDIGYADRTRAMLKRYGITNATVHYAPLRDGADGLRWYEPITLPDAFDVVLCDGPQRQHGRQGLFARLSKSIANATIIVDDAADVTQLAMIKSWCTQQSCGFRTFGSSEEFVITSPAYPALAA